MWVDVLTPPACLWKCVVSFAACLPPPDNHFSGGLASRHCYTPNEMDETGFKETDVKTTLLSCYFCGVDLLMSAGSFY